MDWSSLPAPSPSVSRRSSESAESSLMPASSPSISRRSSETVEGILFSQAEFDRCSRSQSKVLDSHMKIITEQMEQISALVDGMDELREELHTLREESDVRCTDMSAALDKVVSAECVTALQQRVEHLEKALAEETGKCISQVLSIDKAANDRQAVIQARLMEMEQASRDLADEQTHRLGQLCQETCDQMQQRVDSMDMLVGDLKTSHDGHAQELVTMKESIESCSNHLVELRAATKQEHATRSIQHASLQERLDRAETRHTSYAEKHDGLSCEFRTLDTNFRESVGRLSAVEDFNSQWEERVEAVEALLGTCADKSELNAVSVNLDTLYSKVHDDLEAHSDSTEDRCLGLEHRLVFLESKVSESVDAATKEMDLVSVVAQQQLDLAARISAKTRKLRNKEVNATGALKTKPRLTMP